MKEVIWGLLIPFAGTVAGAGCVFFLKREPGTTSQRAMTGFAAGVMVAASFWSLLQPALDSSTGMGTLAFLPAAAGFLAGVGFLLALDIITPHMHMDRQNEGLRSTFKRTTKLIFAVTLHNIPEGMAVGVVYAGLLAGSVGITAGGALTLALAAVTVFVAAYGFKGVAKFSSICAPWMIVMFFCGVLTPSSPFLLFHHTQSPAAFQQKKIL